MPEETKTQSRPRQLELEDSTTGQKIQIDWFDSTDPTDNDIEEIFKNLPAPRATGEFQQSPIPETQVQKAQFRRKYDELENILGNPQYVDVLNKIRVLHDDIKKVPPAFPDDKRVKEFNGIVESNQDFLKYYDDLVEGIAKTPKEIQEAAIGEFQPSLDLNKDWAAQYLKMMQNPGYFAVQADLKKGVDPQYNAAADYAAYHDKLMILKDIAEGKSPELTAPPSGAIPEMIGSLVKGVSALTPVTSGAVTTQNDRRSLLNYYIKTDPQFAAVFNDKMLPERDPSVVENVIGGALEMAPSLLTTFLVGGRIIKGAFPGIAKIEAVTSTKVGTRIFTGAELSRIRLHNLITAPARGMLLFGTEELLRGQPTTTAPIAGGTLETSDVVARMVGDALPAKYKAAKYLFPITRAFLGGVSFAAGTVGAKLLEGKGFPSWKEFEESFGQGALFSTVHIVAEKISKRLNEKDRTLWSKEDRAVWENVHNLLAAKDGVELRDIIGTIEIKEPSAKPGEAKTITVEPKIVGKKFETLSERKAREETERMTRAQAVIQERKRRFALERVPVSEMRGVKNVPEEPKDIEEIRSQMLGMPAGGEPPTTDALRNAVIKTGIVSEERALRMDEDQLKEAFRGRAIASQTEEQLRESYRKQVGIPERSTPKNVFFIKTKNGKIHLAEISQESGIVDHSSMIEKLNINPDDIETTGWFDEDGKPSYSYNPELGIEAGLKIEKPVTLLEKVRKAKLNKPGAATTTYADIIGKQISLGEAREALTHRKELTAQIADLNKLARQAVDPTEKRKILNQIAKLGSGDNQLYKEMVDRFIQDVFSNVDTGVTALTNYTDDELEVRLRWLEDAKKPEDFPTPIKGKAEAPSELSKEDREQELGDATSKMRLAWLKHDDNPSEATKTNLNLSIERVKALGGIVHYDKAGKPYTEEHVEVADETIGPEEAPAITEGQTALEKRLNELPDEIDTKELQGIGFETHEIAAGVLDAYALDETHDIQEKDGAFFITAKGGEASEGPEAPDEEPPPEPGPIEPGKTGQAITDEGGEEQGEKPPTKLSLRQREVLSFLEGELPTKKPVKKDRISFDDVPPVNINVRPRLERIKVAKGDTHATLVEIMSEIIDLNDLRAAMHGIYYDGEAQVVVATNGHALLVIPKTGIKGSELLDLDGGVMDERFPAYNTVIPTNNTRVYNGLPLQDLLNQVGGIYRADQFIESISGAIKVGIENHNGKIQYFAAHNLLSILRAFAVSGTTKINLDMSENVEKALLLSDPDVPGKIGVAMPLRGEKAAPHKIILSSTIAEETRVDKQEKVSEIEKKLAALREIKKATNFTSIKDSEGRTIDLDNTIKELESELAKVEAPKLEVTKPNVPSERPIADAHQLFLGALRMAISKGEKLDKRALDKLAASHGIKDVNLAKELTELVIAQRARKIIFSGSEQAEKLRQLEALYKVQPSLTSRTSESIDKQQYSTPVPLAYIMSLWVGADKRNSVFDPSAGNGLLLVGSDPFYTHANEIDVPRRSNLDAQGFALVTDFDAREIPTDYADNYDAVLTNPPFGEGEARDYSGYQIAGLEKQMAIEALDTMNDGGRAAIIIGGHNSYDETGRLKSDLRFFNYLNHFYNVVDVMNIDGDLYSGQGTKFPIRLILIDGRKNEAAGAAPLYDEVRDKVQTSFAEIFNRAKERGFYETVGGSTDINKPGGGNTVRGGDEGRQPRLGGTTDPLSPTKAGTPDKGESGGGKERVGPAGKPSGLRGGRKPVAKINRPGDTIQSPDIGETGASRIKDVLDSSKGEEGKPDSPRGPGVVRRDNPVASFGSGEFSIAYGPHSRGQSAGVKVPTNLAYDINKMLNEFEERNGPIDDYLQEKLGYDSKAELFDAFSSEQIDGIGLVLEQIENGGAFIIGDQTGIGKGRIGAAVIRYAHANKLNTIFFTEKDNLFSDLHRDLVDIGSGDLKPFIVNNKVDITDLNGEVVHESPDTPEQRRIFESGDLKGYDFSIITYSQISSEKAFKKRDFISKIAPGSIIILDESHNAAGESNTGIFMMNRIQEAKGVVYMSATFEKAPKNMPLYAIRTAMREANLSRSELMDAVTRGGIALQQALSADLVKAGQMIRREQSFDGVQVDWLPLTQHKSEHAAISDKITGIIRDIISFQSEFVSPVISHMDDRLAKHGMKSGGRKGTKDAGVDNQPFVSKVYSVIEQMLFAIKVDDVAKEAISILKDDKKPVIVFRNTMESFLKGSGLSAGDKMKSGDFGLSLKRALDGVLRYTLTEATGDKGYLKLDPMDLGPRGEEAYKELSERIFSSTTDIPVSPIDYLIEAVEKAGYKVGELTGRKMMVKKQPNGQYVISDRVDTDRNKIIRQFNSGETDVLLFNVGAGFSVHASEKFIDKRQRVMIIHQPDLDISKEMQKRGRVHRKGQVVPPAYRYVFSEIPAESRLMMMLNGKLKSLDANTTSSQKSVMSVVSTDFLNKYGDRIVIEYLKENRELADRLGDPLKFHEMGEEEVGRLHTVPGAARKITGRVAILPTLEQTEFYTEINQRYGDYIDYLTQTESNDLELRVLPLRAKTIGSRVIVAGKGGKSPFGKDTLLETIEADVLRKPMKRADIESLVKKTLGGKTSEAYRDELLKQFESQLELYNKKRRHALSYDNPLYKMRLESLNRALERQEAVIKSALDEFTVGQVYAIPEVFDSALSSHTSPGVFLGFSINKTAKHPFVPSSVKLSFALGDQRRLLTLPLSQREAVGMIIDQSRYNDRTLRSTLDNWDSSKAFTVNREQREILTGNILQGMKKDLVPKPDLVTFTMEDGEVRRGILLPSYFSLAEGEDTIVPVSRAFSHISGFWSGAEIETVGGVEIAKRYSGEYKISVPASKQSGGKYFLDPDIRALVDDKNFVKTGSRMVANLKPERLKKFLNILQEKFSDSVTIPTEKMDKLPGSKSSSEVSTEARWKQTHTLYETLNKKPLTHAPGFSEKAIAIGSQLYSVSGKEIQIDNFHSGRFLVYQIEGGFASPFSVVEATTGYLLSSGESKEDALAGAKKFLDSMGIKRFEETLAETPKLPLDAVKLNLPSGDLSLSLLPGLSPTDFEDAGKRLARLFTKGTFVMPIDGVEISDSAINSRLKRALASPGNLLRYLSIPYHVGEKYPGFGNYYNRDGTIKSEGLWNVVDRVGNREYLETILRIKEDILNQFRDIHRLTKTEHENLSRVARELNETLPVNEEVPYSEIARRFSLSPQELLAYKQYREAYKAAWEIKKELSRYKLRNGGFLPTSSDLKRHLSVENLIKEGLEEESARSIMDVVKPERPKGLTKFVSRKLRSIIVADHTGARHAFTDMDAAREFVAKEREIEKKEWEARKKRKMTKDQIRAIWGVKEAQTIIIDGIIDRMYDKKTLANFFSMTRSSSDPFVVLAAQPKSASIGTMTDEMRSTLEEAGLGDEDFDEDAPETPPYVANFPSLSEANEHAGGLVKLGYGPYGDHKGILVFDARRDQKEEYSRGLTESQLMNLVQSAGVDIENPFIAKIIKALRSRGFNRHLIHRERAPGYRWTREHMERSVVDYVEGAAREYAKFVARNEANKKLEKLKAGSLLPSAIIRYAEQYLDAWDFSHPLEWATLRQGIYFTTMAGSISNFAQNLTQPWTTTLPSIPIWLKEAKTKTLKANFPFTAEALMFLSYKDAFAYGFFKLAGRFGKHLPVLTREWIDLAQRSDAQGVTTPLQLEQLAGITHDPRQRYPSGSKAVRVAKRAWRTVFDLAFVLQRLSEVLNRYQTFFARLRIADWMGLDSTAKFEYGVGGVQGTQFQFGSHNLPLMGLLYRGEGPPAFTRRMVSLALILRGFSLNFLGLSGKIFRSGVPTSQIRYILSQFSFAGVRGFVGYGLFLAAWNFWLWLTGDEETAEMKERSALGAAEEKLGLPDRTLTTGPVGSLTGVETSRLLGAGDIVPTKVKNIPGVPYSLLERSAYAYQEFQRDNPMRGIQQLPFVPRMASSYLRGKQAEEEGVISGPNIVMRKEELTPQDINILKSGGTPTKLMQRYEEAKAVSTIGDLKEQKQKDFQNRMIRAIESGDVQARKGIFQDINEFNRKHKQHPGSENFISGLSVLARAIREHAGVQKFQDRQKLLRRIEIEKRYH